jgi:hypothetical protein
MINQQTTFPSDSMLSIQSPKTNKVYKFGIERQTRTAYAEYMNPSTKYEREYFQVTVYSPEGKMLNFGFVDDITNTDEVNGKVLDVISRIENPGPDIGSRFD